MKLAVLGLGTMGAPMAENLIKAGFEVTVHNRTRNREEPLEQLGAARAGNPAAAAADAEIVLSCVSDTPDVESILLDPEQGAITTLKPGALVVDCSSIEPEATRRMARQLREKDIGFVDAPVSGGSEGAIHGTLTVDVRRLGGGTTSARSRCCRLSAAASPASARSAAGRSRRWPTRW